MEGINRESVMKAGGIGAIIGVVIGLVSGAINLLDVGFLATLLWVFTCCGAVLFPLSVGALYGFFTPGKEELQQAAIGGAISGLVAGLGYGITNSIISTVVFVVGGQSFADAISDGVGVFGLACCLALLLGPIFGAAGGAIWMAVQGEKA